MAFKKSIGLDIADHTIEVLELTRGFVGEAKVSAAGRMSLNPGIVANGRIIDAPALKAALLKLFAQSKPTPIDIGDICFGLPDSQIYTRVFVLPPHHAADRDELVWREALNSIPIDEDNLNYSYKVLAEAPAGVEILLAAVGADVVREWHDFFVDMKIKVTAFDLEPLALARGLLLKSSGPVIVLDIGSATTNLFIFNKEGLAYSRCLITAGDYLTAKISTALSISLAEAEEQKIKFGLSYPDNKIVPVIQEVLKEISERALESITYFEERKKEKVGNFILIGGTSQMFGLLDYFKTSLQRPGIIAQMKFDNKIIPLLYVEAAGLALRTIDDKYKNDLKMSVTVGKTLSEIMPPVAAAESGEVYSPEAASSDDNRQLSKSLAPPKIAEEKVKSKLLLLVNILIIGVVLIGAAWQYRNYDKKNQAAVNQASVINYDHLQSLDVKIEVATSGLENNDNRVVGRISRVVVASSTSLAAAEESAKILLATDLKSGEKFYREPLNRDKLLASLQFPAIFEWLVYDQRSYLAIVSKEMDKINTKKIPFALNGAELLAANKTASADVFSLDCRVGFYANEDIKK